MITILPAKLGFHHPQARGRRRCFVRPQARRLGARAGRCYLLDMNALKAHVKNGQIVLDEPGELEEGAELLVFPVSDEMDAADRAELNAMLDESFQQLDAGDTVDGPTYLAELRARL